MQKKVIAAGLICAAAVVAGIGILAVKTGKAEEEQKLESNQRIAYAYVTSIEGNELTYMEVEESEAQALLEKQETSDDAAAENEGGKTERSDGSSGVPEGEMPDLAEGEMPGKPGKDNADVSAESGKESSGAPQREETKTVTTYLPVGITVHTASEAETSFLRLAAGDFLKVLIETDADGNDVIIEVWMIL